MPRRNNTPKHAPYTDRRADCSHKQRYPQEEAAKRAAELRMLENPSLHLSTYLCETCRYWHLTSIPQTF